MGGGPRLYTLSCPFKTRETSHLAELTRRPQPCTCRAAARHGLPGRCGATVCVEGAEGHAPR